MSILGWLSQSHGSPKHCGLTHPVVVCLLHYAIVISTTIAVHDYLVIPALDYNNNDYYAYKDFRREGWTFSVSQCSNETRPTDEEQPQIEKHTYLSQFLALYFLFLLTARLLGDVGIARTGAIYGFTWLCNTAMVFSVIGIETCRPLLGSSSAVAVSIDQVLWYVDIIGWVLSGCRKFPIGVAKYLTWPQTTWVTKVTCTHHLWCIPLLIYGSYGMHYAAYPLSTYIVASHVILSRWLTPFKIIPCLVDGNNDKKKFSNNRNNNNGSKFKRVTNFMCGTPSIFPDPSTTTSSPNKIKLKEMERYCNVNLSHELWSDIQFSQLRTSTDTAPDGATYILRLLSWWNGIFNLIIFCLLYLLGRFFLGKATVYKHS